MTEKYFELIEAGVPEVARACGCEVGQWVARIYPLPTGAPVERIGTEDEVRAFVKQAMEAK